MQNNETEKKTSVSFFSRLRSGIRTLTHPNGSRHGTVAAGMIALAVVVVILLNLALGAMDSSVFDLTSQTSPSMRSPRSPGIMRRPWRTISTSS